MKWKKGDPIGLVYDIETALMPALVFGLGEQVIRHNQLLTLEPQIICIAYAYLHKPGVHVLTWDPKTRSSKKMIEKFDKIIKEADFIIGKNSDKFDNKRINTQRLLNDLPPLPDWIDKCDDLEKQMRKYFYMPSQSLDFVSDILGFGHKAKMEFEDWKAIYIAGLRTATTSQVIKGDIAFAKMCRYCKRDVDITKKVILKVMPHVKFKFNRSVWHDEARCRVPTCGSKNLGKDGTRLVSGVKKQRYKCKDCGGFAGYHNMTAKPNTPLR